MWWFWVAKLGKDDDKFWRLSWYTFAMYVDQYNERTEEAKAIEEGHWARFRIEWADFRNVNRGKSGKIYHPRDLIKLSVDETPVKYHTIDIDAIKRRLGSKLKKNGK